MEVGGLLQDVLLETREDRACLRRPRCRRAMSLTTSRSESGWKIGRTLAVESRILSPFDFRNQVLLCLPDDLPPPDSARFDRALAGALQRWLEASGGPRLRIVYLVSVADGGVRRAGPAAGGARHARAQARDGFAARGCCRGFAAANGPCCSARTAFGKASTCRAMRCRSSSSRACRFGCRPIRSRRRGPKRVEARGGDSFVQYSLPRAIMKFRQGFGRLIRTKSDKGAVIIADTRVHQRSYGRRFLVGPANLSDGAR